MLVSNGYLYIDWKHLSQWKGTSRSSPWLCKATAWKVSKYGAFCDSYFPVFRLNTKIVNIRIQSEYRKIRTRKNSVFGHFSRSEQLNVWKFQVSNGWFYIWNSPCNTLFKKVTGQSESVAPKMAASWKEMSLGWKE